MRTKSFTITAAERQSATLDLLRSAVAAVWCRISMRADMGGGNRGPRQGTGRLGVLLVAVLCSLVIAAAPPAPAEKYQSDDWLPVCEPEPGTDAPGCSITATFGGMQNG